MRIGELAKAADTTTKTLRFYEAEGLLPTSPRTSSGYRDYGHDAIDRIGFIHVRDLLDTRLAAIDQQLTQLLDLRTTLTELRARADQIAPDTCRADQVCRYL